MKYDWKNLGRALTPLALAVLVSTVFAVYLSGFSSETFYTFTIILQGFCASVFWVTVLLGLIFLFRGWRKQKEIGRSRDKVRMAYNTLFAYLEKNSLKGYDDTECQRLQKMLEQEIWRHLTVYIFDIFRGDIRRYREYSREVAELEKIE